MQPNFNDINNMTLLDKLGQLHLFATEGIFLRTCLYEERALWFQDEQWMRYFSKDYLSLLPNIEPAAVHTIKSPCIGPEASRVMERNLLGTDTGDYSVQLVRCSHIDWHDDCEVAEANNLHPGVVLFCLSDNPLGMALYQKSKTGEITKTPLYKGQAFWLDDHLPHAVLPDKKSDVDTDTLNNTPLSLVTFQQKKTESEESFCCNEEVFLR